jgi:NAD(P)H-flavin reductase/ferredoxin
MLVWDRLAQFVVVASFEWLDWLPTFGGALMRNFIYADSVNDRLFSLLAFMHIGIPLVVLLVMWVHVQRVPKANTEPARPVMAGLLGTMLALALAKPVLSQGGAADLGVAVGTLAFDWFYLPVFPLLYAWPLAHVWALLAGATLLLVALPWLPPRFRRGKAAEFRMRIQPDTQRVAVRAGETLLEAGLRAGIALPYECRNGGCGVCRCSIVQGSVDHGAYQPSALPDALRDRGEALLCCATPLSDVEIALDPASRPVRAPVPLFTGRVDSIERLSEEVIRLMVSLPEGQRMDFVAGQYVNIVLEDGQRRAFSFANPPHANERMELHVRLISGGRFTTHVFTGMQAGDPLAFEGPLGAFTLHESTRPILFVAGATGFAPIKSIVEDAFHRGISRPMHLYWGVKQRRDLYLLELAERWAREHPNFKVVPVLSDPDPADAWSGRTGMVHAAMLEDFPDLTGYEVYVCGSVKMVETAIPAFLTQGLAEDVCFSDAFVPARTRGEVSP